jgi:[acyl-carrier-protein] S-malonyltransferase
MLVITAPGQGAQAPGFLAPWLELPSFADRLSAWSELAGLDLIRCGTTADADEIRDTAVAQPLLVAAAIAAAEALFGGIDQARTQLGAVAGHSVGELAAGVIAGVLSPEDAMRLVRVRGQAMARAAANQPTGMTAVLGGDEAAVLDAIEALGLTPANINGAGQIVAAGTLDQLEKFAAEPPAGARLRPLRVAGAFHTEHMAPAVDALRAAAATIQVSDPAVLLLSNRDGAVVRSGADWLERIITQVSAPVRWNLCMREMARLGAGAVIELPPAGTLTGLARRGLPGVALGSLKTPDDLAAARVLIGEHGTVDPYLGGQVPEWRLLVAPLSGTFRTAAAETAAAETAAGETVPVAAGAALPSGAEIGHVEQRGGRHPITPPFPATVIEWLVEDGDPVSAGQPLIRLQPEQAG